MISDVDQEAGGVAGLYFQVGVAHIMSIDLSTGKYALALLKFKITSGNILYLMFLQIHPTQSFV